MHAFHEVYQLAFKILNKTIHVSYMFKLKQCYQKPATVCEIDKYDEIHSIKLDLVFKLVGLVENFRLQLTSILEELMLSTTNIPFQ